MLPLFQAVLWMMGTLVSFTSLAIAGRALLDTIGVFEVMFFRNLIGLLILLAFTRRGFFSLARTDRLGFHCFRNALQFAGQSMWFAALTLLPLATVFALEFTIPIWAAIMAVLFLSEHMNQGRVVAVGLGFIGILLITRPGFTAFDPAMLMMILVAIFFAGNLIATKSLTNSDSALTIIFYMCALQAPLGLGLALLDWRPVAMEDLIWIAILGITGLSSHYCLARAFALADATVVIPMDFMRLPLAAMVGFWLYNEVFDAAVLAGAALICAGIYYSLRFEAQLARGE